MSPNQPRRTLLLTGASRGIGHATVKRFSAAGWRVITCSRHPFPENCPWEAGPEDHIQVDLADEENTRAAIAEIKRRLATRELHALVNNAAISPKAQGGGRLSTLDTTNEDWHHVFQVNFFAPIMLARTPVRRRGIRDLEGSARRAHSRNGERFRAPRHPRQRHRARRDRHCDSFAGHGEDRRTDPDAPPRNARRGGQDHLRALHRHLVLCQRRRDSYQRRAARLNTPLGPAGRWP